MNKRFEVGETVVYIGKQNGKIHTVEVGKIKKLATDGAFVYYHTGDTAAKTDYKDLYKIRNLYAINNLGNTKEIKKDKPVREEKQIFISFLYEKGFEKGIGSGTISENKSEFIRRITESVDDYCKDIAKENGLDRITLINYKFLRE